MKREFQAADAYNQSFHWQDMALLKVCLYSIGVLVGLSIPFRSKKLVGMISLLAVVLTYIPLIARFLPFLYEADLFEIRSKASSTSPIVF